MHECIECIECIGRSMHSMHYRPSRSIIFVDSTSTHRFRFDSMVVDRFDSLNESNSFD